MSTPMEIELQDALPCCKQSLGEIRNKYDAAGCLEEFLAISPTLINPMFRVSFVGILWRIAKGTYDWRKHRKATSVTIKPILQNRIRLIIDLELVRHGNDPKLSKQWSRLREQLLQH